ncbi:MAG: hypothetical protein AB4290_29445 [Spirulina sp.]
MLGNLPRSRSGLGGGCDRIHLGSISQLQPGSDRISFLRKSRY